MPDTSKHDIDTDIQVLNYLFDNVDRIIGKAIKSPFGGDDNPSFSFYISKSDNPRIRYNLFNKGENGSLIDFMAAYPPLKCDGNIGLALQTYEDIINGSDQLSKKEVLSIKKGVSDNPPPDLTVNNFFRIDELDYWKDYKIDEWQLIYEEVYSVAHLYYSGFCTDRSMLGTPVFAYLYRLFEQDNGIPFKIYNPLSADRRWKWKSHSISNVVCGYESLPQTADFISFNTSKKDYICYKNELCKQLGVNYMDVASVAPPAEGSIYPLLNREKEFIDRFNTIHIIKDTDPDGILLADKLYNSLKYKEKAKIIDVDYGIDHRNICKYPYCKDIGEGILNNNKLRII